MIISDLRSYFRNTWAFDTINKIPVFIQDIIVDGNDIEEEINQKYHDKFVSFNEVLKEKHIKAICSSLKEEEVERSTVHTKHLSVSWPRMGLVNFGDNAVLVSRMSARTMVKGLSSRTASIQYINQGAISTLHPTIVRAISGFNQIGPHDPTSHMFMREVYCSKYPNIREATNQLLTGDGFSVALSNRIGLAMLPRYNRLVIYLYNKPIGTYDIKTKTVQIRKNTFSHASSKILIDEINELLGVTL